MTSRYNWDDTIIAMATPPGIGAIGVIRLSGPQAFSIINQLFPSKDLEIQPSHTLHVGMLRQGEAWLDEVVVSLFRGPRSYTGGRCCGDQLSWLILYTAAGNAGLRDIGCTRGPPR